MEQPDAVKCHSRRRGFRSSADQAPRGPCAPRDGMELEILSARLAVWPDSTRDRSRSESSAPRSTRRRSLACSRTAASGHKLASHLRAHRTPHGDPTPGVGPVAGPPGAPRCTPSRQPPSIDSNVDIRVVSSTHVVAALWRIDPIATSAPSRVGYVSLRAMTSPDADLTWNR